MDSKDNFSILLPNIEENEKSIENVLPSNSSNYCDVVSPMISGAEAEIPIFINPQSKLQVLTNILSNENCEEVRKDPSISSAGIENVECRSESIIVPYGITPSKEISKRFIFQQGVTFTSTPLNEKEIKKGMGHVFDNLSIIKEEEESLSVESKESAEQKPENFSIIKEEEVSLSVESKESAKQKPDNLSIIKEEEESLSVESKESAEQKPENLSQTEKEYINADKVIKSSDLSVLKKDELSLLIDNANGRILKEEKIDVNNNHLTLSVQNHESVVYKNIIDKTVDDLLIEGHELERIKEQCNLESDKNEILDKVVILKPFISPNEDENRDNNDPEWELLKKLETDDERYKLVRKLWRNLAIPDLKQNLSTFNWRNKNSLPALKNIVPIKANQIGKRKQCLMYECTEVFDVGIQKLEDFCQRQYQGLRLESDNELSIMASLNKKPRLDGPSYDLRSTAHVPQWDYQTDYDKIIACFQERLQRHLDAKQEIKAVHGFYNGLKNQGNEGYGNVMLISHKERQDMLEIESMISHYSMWYNQP